MFLDYLDKFSQKPYKETKFTKFLEKKQQTLFERLDGLNERVFTSKFQKLLQLYIIFDRFFRSFRIEGKSPKNYPRRHKEVNFYEYQYAAQNLAWFEIYETLYGGLRLILTALDQEFLLEEIGKGRLRINTDFAHILSLMSYEEVMEHLFNTIGEEIGLTATTQGVPVTEIYIPSTLEILEFYKLKAALVGPAYLKET